MINRKRAIALVIIIGLLLIALIIYLVWFRGKDARQGTIDETPGFSSVLPEINTSTPGTKPRNYQNYDISKEEPHIIGANDLGKIGMNFSERFGSFSKQANFGNIEDAKLFMTESLRRWADSYTKQLKEDYQDRDFYEIETKAIAFTVISFNEEEGSARIVVETMRRESESLTEQGDDFMQELTLDFVLTGDRWLIDAAYWEKK